MKRKDTPEPGNLDKAAASAPAEGKGGPGPDRPFSGANEGVGTGRASEDDRAGKHHHDGWNSNT